MLSVVRVLFLTLCMGAGLPAQARDLYILVIGENAAANCNAQAFGEVAGVVQIGLDGEEKPAHDPLEWADCKGGSIWIPLGEALIRRGLARKVVFMPVALSGARVRDWHTGGRGAALLARAIDMAKAKHIGFDYAFLQQGFSDSATGGVLYRSGLRSLMRTISLQVRVDRWLVAQSAGCIRIGAPQIAAIHEEAAHAHQLNRYAGPDFSAFTRDELGESCTFTVSGQEKAARWWMDSMLLAEEASRKFQKESLLYYFK